VLRAARRARLLRPRRGEGLRTVETLSLGGRLPINTSGGLLGEAYIHGMNGITEPCARSAARPATR
jgi:hypothetical protein